MNRKLNKVLSSTVVLSMVLAPGATWAAADTTAPVTTTTAAPAQTTQQTTTTGDTVTVGTQPAFTDMNKAAEWAKPFIIQAKEQKLINGDPDGKFRPLDNLSRREAAAIIVNVLGLEPVKADKSSFRDLSVNDWSSKYVEALKKEGIMQGDGKGSFFPNNKITREELAVILVEAVDGDIAGKGKDLNLKDENKVSGWAKPYVQVAMEMNLLKGDGKGSFFPKNNATRQEMAVMAVNLAEALKDAETPAEVVPATDTSAVKVEAGTENTYKVTMTVKDAEAKGVTGLKGDDFTVKLRGQSYVVGQTNTFKDFSEKGEGVYEVTFAPGMAVNEKVEVTAKGVTIAKDLQVGLAEMSTYKVTTSDAPAEGLPAVSQLVDTKDKTQEQINEAVTAATKDMKPVKVTLATDVKGQKGYEAVRIDKVNAGENVQLWAKDTQGNWYDVNQVGWGPEAGFPLAADTPETVTDVYVLSDKAGEYPLNVKVVDVKTGNVIAQREEKVTVKAADAGSTDQTGVTSENGTSSSGTETN